MNTRDVVHLPDAPTLPGLWFRRFWDAHDYAQIARVHERSCEWDRVDVHSAREHIPTAEELAATFPEAEIRGHADLLLALIGDQVAGYSHVRWRWIEITGARVYLHLGYLVPEWRGKGLGMSLLRWSHQRIREIAADECHPGPTTFATNVSSTEREADALMQHAGYSPVRCLSDMVLEPLTPPPVFPLPAEIRLRPLEPGQYRAVYDAWKDAFAGLWTSTPEGEEDYEEFLAENIDVPSFDPALYHIPWDGDHVAGLVFSRIRKDIGVIPEVAVRRAWQRRGIARSLMSYGLNKLHDRGVTQVRLFTDADNGQGARTLYEGFGFREAKQHIFYRKPFDSRSSTTNTRA